MWDNERKHGSPGMSAAKNACAAMRPGDKIAVQLLGNKVGRIGEIVRVEADKWRPLIPISKQHRYGEMGRHILVRWDLLNGPPSSEHVIELPPEARFTPGIRRATICRMPPALYRRIAKVAKDRRYWVHYSPHVFAEEQAISDYLATYPEKLEDGLQPHPSREVREKVFPDKTRADVLLLDRAGKPVIVECKQGTPTKENVDQLRSYLRHGCREFGNYPRGILVHGGAGTLLPVVRRAIRKRPRIEVVRYSLAVGLHPVE